MRVQTIIYIPPDDIEKFVALKAADPYVLSAIKGLGGVECSVISSNIVGMQGSLFHGIKKPPREIPCTIYVHGKSRTDMYKKRMELIGRLRPRDVPGTLVYINDYISVQIQAVPILPPDFNERIKNYNKAEIKLWCPDPVWQSLEIKSASVAAQEGVGFTLPFSFPISFASVINEISVENFGTTSAPVTITITGPGDNPTITNLANGKKIALLDKSLDSNEQLIINTERGKKSVKLYKNGTETDAFQYIDPASEFWELEVGENRIVYSSDDNAKATRIVISWIERYEGV